MHVIRGGPEQVHRVRGAIEGGSARVKVFEQLILSIPDRVRESYAAKGWHTGF